MKKLLIWDIDGTILDCKGCGRMALSRTFERLHGHRDAFVDVDLTGKIDIEVIEEVVRHHVISDFNLERFMTAYGRVLEDVMHQIEGIGVLPGVREVLDRIKDEKDYYLTIATGNCKTGALGKMSHCGVDAYFETGAYGDQARDRAALIGVAIRNAQAHYGVDFDETGIFYLGDTPKDIEAAKANGIQSVAVSTGFYTREALKSHLPHYLLESMEDMDQVRRIFEFGR